jgi:NADH:ubiquinone oxidoreductase subunit E|tara:strand:- start:106 stop:303 length:198 start_codon:yes stop_codon:yes gene_type:complete
MININENGEPVIEELPKCCISECDGVARFMIQKDFYCGKHFQKYYELLEEAQAQQTDRFKRLLKK